MSLTLFTAPGDAERGAQISACGRYRYTLWRRWDFARPSVLFIMLNPSTADADHDDPTIRRCIGFADRWGAGGIRVVNLYPWRATNPRDLPKGLEVFGELPEGHERNAHAIRAAAADAGRIIAAWGAHPGPWPSQPMVVMGALRGRLVEALALTKDGSPRHPLYVRGDVQPIIYSEARRAA
jgi:hypothetical protein